MMPNIIFRVSIRRMSSVVNDKKKLCRLLSSTTNNTSTSSERVNVSNPIDYRISVKYDPNGNPVTSSVVENQILKEIIGPSLSTAVGSTKPNYTTGNAIDSSSVGNNGNSNNAGNSNNDDGGSSATGFRSVYVHPLSQIVLEYLQDSHHGWIVANGLDQSLILHRDGSFELKHKPQPHAAISTPRPTRPYSSNNQKKDYRNGDSEPISPANTSATAAMIIQKNNQIQPASLTKETSESVVRPKKHQQEHKNENTTIDSPIDTSDNIRIWTSYDEQEKKHWLTFRRGLFRQRFLLQDNLLTAWQSNRGISLQERLHAAVDDMIGAVDRHERQGYQAPIMGQQQWKQKGQRRFRKR
mmetsp:Transcript_2866/g.7866  ORF Transcript_2866/g.7866 Transcript_2866/m.7866 type:complete len:354 (+) Transcript_2866:193-1254(+)|eukprot:CAMPEP_0197181214 /NCGR_PEP_ID=MMETSP1423-20130617/5564_1 /TAXON_ID=476441 /ORGANISM="Pseudo-nitzschia heimii, Strain UNC1101" /LENGTH=353 /DNA_ID=CAMNT_0042631423 /DNA_START=142 /DNA_END=1203 /DNA_ORIENTATION=+